MIRKKSILALVLFAPLCIVPLIFCSSPATADDVDRPEEEFSDLSEIEHCISNIMLSYAEKNFEKYAELFHEDYTYWAQGEKQWGVQRELESAAQLFKSAKLSIEIETGSWTDIDEVEGSPCRKCWESTRKYTITFQQSEGGATMSGSGYAKYIVNRVEDNGNSKYKILAIFDLGDEPPKEE